MQKITCPIEIVEMLASRICHDLISPVGAINNGMEFMREMGEDAGDDAIDLIEHSANQASAKLQIFRLSYGAGGRDSHIKPENIYNAFEKLLNIDNKIKQQWDPLSPNIINNLPEGWCKIISATMMMAIETLPKGGTISINRENETTTITANGQNCKTRDYTQEALENLLPSCDIDSRLVHPYICGLLSKEYGYSIELSENDEKVTFNITNK